jgi:hypothetical protein
VHLGLQLNEDERGRFLVPAYVFETKDDGELLVAAVTDADARAAGGFGSGSTPGFVDQGGSEPSGGFRGGPGTPTKVPPDAPPTTR